MYLAEGLVPGSRQRLKVAVKQLREQGTPRELSALRREFRLLEKVRHRTICKVYEFLEDSKAVVMEVVEGRTLREVLDHLAEKKESMPVEAAVEITMEIADCLYQAHSALGEGGEPMQLVHSDIKPENIMITPGGEVKVLDFGLATVHHPGGRRAVGKGTPLYMAPEQARKGAVDHRTDLFSVGLLMVEMLVGRAAYDIPIGVADPERAVWKMIEQADVGEALGLLERRVPAFLPIVRKCLQLSPRRRFATGRELLLELRGHLLRDRGAELRAFCDYYFGYLCPLDTTARVASEDQHRDNGRRTSPGRRQQSMADDKPPRPKGPPRPGGPARPGGPPRPKGPTGPPRASGNPRSASSSSGPPSRPPAAAPPTAPSSSSGRSAPSNSSARSPDETGMLQMTPLDGPEPSPADTKGKSATAFFALPAAKKSNKPPPPPDAPTGGFQPEATSGRGLPGPSAANVSLPPTGAPGGGMGISGPVASGPVASSNTSPFTVGQSVAVGDDIGDESRAKTYRVYFIVSGLMLMVMTVTCVGLAAVLWGMNQEDPSAGNSTAVVAPKTKPAPSNKGATDTAAAADLPPPPPPARPRPSGRPRSTTPRSAPVAARPAAPSIRDVTIQIPSGVYYTAAEITCAAHAYRKRGAFSGGAAKVVQVPPADCEVHFKGGAPAMAKISGSAPRYNCTFPSGVAVCK